MKNYFKLLSILILLLSFNVNAEESHVQGELRCPKTLSSNAVSCTVAAYGDDGKPDQIDITYLNKQGDKYIKIVKTVKRQHGIDNLGIYDVSFLVSGNLDVVSASGPTYIYIIVDGSSTMTDNDKNAEKRVKNAITAFAKTLIPDSENGKSNYYLAAIRFGDEGKGGRYYIRENFKNSNFKNGLSWGGDLGPQSFINEPLSLVKKKFINSNIPENANKYVLIFGDGNYWNDQSISRSGAESALSDANTLRKLGVKVIGILYSDGHPGSLVGCGSMREKQNKKYTKLCTVCTDKTIERTNNESCNKAAMKVLTNDNYYDASKMNSAKWQEVFVTTANNIASENQGGKVYIELTDQLGNEFFKLNDSGRYENFELSAITEKGQLLGSFPIEIDEFADPDAAINDGLEKYWHKTNSNFKFTYTSPNEGLTSFIVEDSPEVYWIPNDPSFDDCYSAAQVRKVRSEDVSDEYSFFSKVCYEGGWDNLPGFKVTANVNNFTGNPDESQNQFTLFQNSGYKFPASLDMEANLICTYNFKVADFNSRHDELNKDYTDIQAQIAPLESKSNLTAAEKDNLELLKKTEASLYIKLDDLNKILNRYKSLVNDTSDLEKYQADFKDQTATLKIDYDDSKVQDTNINFVNKGDVINKMECTKGDTEKLYNGDKITYHKECKLSMTKSMELPKACLDMQSGEANTCKNDTPQIDGGNNFFINLLAKGGGKISVTVPKAGYTNKLDFEMKDDKNGKSCYYVKDNPDNNNNNINFRQIDVADPFLKNFDRERGIGKNFSNITFDFEKIIHDDTWSTVNIAEYDYFLSKTNIANIRKNTAEDLKHSYLGRSCYFTNDNKYQCRFTRNINDNNTDNGTIWYSNKNFKEGV